MRHRWVRSSVVVVVGLLVVLAATVYLMSRDWAPAKPDSIPRGDHAYTRELAAYRFEELLDRHHVPGGAAALIVDQDVIWSATAGFADIAKGQPVSKDTVFKLWSLAKVFTALEIMRLVEEGLIDLDEPVERYVPGFGVPSRFGPGEPITLRHLLTHHSGLPRNTCVNDTNWHLGADGAEKLAAALAPCRLAYPTGSRYKYSNAAYVLLGYLIQAQRGEIFPPWMQRELLHPIGMKDSAFWSTDVPRGRSMAMGYRYAEGEQIPLVQHDSARVPSGNLYGSLQDLTAFLHFLFRQGEVEGGRLIGEETLASMFEDHGSRPGDPQPVGLGWRLSRAMGGEVLVWHDGGPSEGIGVQIALLPDRKLGAVFIGNGAGFESPFVMPVIVELLEVMLETEKGITKTTEGPPPTPALDASVLRRYEGGYVAFGQLMEVTLADDQLEASIDGMTLDLIARTENTFGVSHWVHRWGLSRLFGVPFDLDALECEFLTGAERAEDRLILDLGRIGYEIAPRYPSLPGRAASWEGLTGVYRRTARLPDLSIGAEEHGTAEIRLVGGRLVMSSMIGPIVPLEDGDLVILGGPFAGETILRDQEGGTLSHQAHVYVPVD